MRTALARAPLSDAQILVDDGDVLVVDKAALVSTQSDGASDLVARVRAFLALRLGVPPAGVYVAAHQLLEREASGAVVLLRKREHNAPFQRALAEGKVEVGYVAAVETKGRRALVRVTPGRVKLRDALARLGRVAGVLGSPVLSFRPLVHAETLRFPHPRTGVLVEVRAPVPALLESWAAGAWTVSPALEGGDLGGRLGRAAARRWPLAARVELTAFRLVNDAADGLPGVVVDLYGEHAVLSVMSEDARAREGELATALLALGARGVYVKRRPKQASVVAETRTDELAPSRPLAGEEAEDTLSVREGDDRFLVRLGDGLSTGVFLDQRDGRAWLRSVSAGRSVLNLFAYACAFTVSAARGGAARTVSVDVARASLARGEANLRANGIEPGGAHAFVVEDALAFLARAKARGDRFDIIVLDPPSFATTKTARFSAEHDYATLAAAALHVVSPGGRLLACTNHRGITQARFRSFLRAAARAAERPIARELERLPPEDFPPQPGAEPHLKTTVLELG